MDDIAELRKEIDRLKERIRKLEKTPVPAVTAGGMEQFRDLAELEYMVNVDRDGTVYAP